MDTTIATARELLALVNEDAGPGSKDELSGALFAILFQAILLRSDIIAYPLRGYLQALKSKETSPTLDVHALDMQVDDGTIVRMNLHGDVAEDVVPGVIRHWEGLSGVSWSGTTRVQRWQATDPKRWATHLPLDYFEKRAALIISRYQANNLEETTPQSSIKQSASPRL